MPDLSEPSVWICAAVADDHDAHRGLLTDAALITRSSTSPDSGKTAWIPITGNLFLLPLITLVTMFFTPEQRSMSRHSASNEDELVDPLISQ